MKTRRPSRTGPVALLVVGIVLSLAPVCGLARTAVLMTGTFSELEQGGDIAKDDLAANMASSFGLTIYELAVALAGLVAIVAAVVWLLKVNRQNAEMP